MKEVFKILFWVLLLLALVFITGCECDCSHPDQVLATPSGRVDQPPKKEYSILIMRP